jgi:hypothetical protein
MSTATEDYSEQPSGTIVAKLITKGYNRITSLHHCGFVVKHNLECINATSFVDTANAQQTYPVKKKYHLTGFESNQLIFWVVALVRRYAAHPTMTQE